MKKLISILATLAMVLSVTSSVIPTAFAEETITYYPNEVGVVGGKNAEATTDLVYGMASAAGVKEYTPRDDASKPTYYAGFIYNDSKAIDATKAAKYVVFETDFAGVDIQNISLYKNQQGEVSRKLTSGWTDNRWSTLRIVYENPTDVYKKGRAAFYINGKLVKDFTENTNAFDTQYRVSFLFNNNEGTLYVKNYRMYASDTNPGAEGAGYTATLTNENLTVFEKKIILPVNVTVGELAVSDNAAIRVYSDSTFETQIADDAVISEGNVVVIEKAGKLDYYDVTGEIKKVIPQPEEWERTNIAPMGTKNGYGGKSSTDTSEYYQHNTGTQAGNIQFKYPLSYYYKYVVVKVNFYFDDASKFSNIQLTTSGTASVDVKSSSVKSGEWNNLILFINTDTEEAKSYLNGKLHSNWKVVSGQFLSDNSDNKKQFRIRVEDSTKAGGGCFAIDDFEMYTTVTLPQVEMDKNYKSISGMHTSANNNAFYKSGATVEELLADSKYIAEGATSVIYDASTGIAASGTMPANAKLAIRTDDSTIKTYTLNSVDGIYAWDNGVGAKAAVAFADSGVMIAAVYDGIRFLRLLPVEVENGVVKAALQYSDGEEVKFMLWNSLSGMKPVYSSVVAP